MHGSGYTVIRASTVAPVERSVVDSPEEEGFETVDDWRESGRAALSIRCADRAGARPRVSREDHAGVETLVDPGLGTGPDDGQPAYVGVRTNRHPAGNERGAIDDDAGVDGRAGPEDEGSPECRVGVNVTLDPALAN